MILQTTLETRYIGNQDVGLLENFTQICYFNKYKVNIPVKSRGYPQNPSITMIPQIPSSFLKNINVGGWLTV